MHRRLKEATDILRGQNRSFRKEAQNETYKTFYRTVPSGSSISISLAPLYCWLNTSAVVLIWSYTPFIISSPIQRQLSAFDSTTVVEKHKFSSPFAVRGRINGCEIKPWKANMTWWGISFWAHSSSAIMLHNLLIYVFFFSLTHYFHTCIFNWECLCFFFWHTSRGRNQTWLQLVKLTVGHRGDEEEGPEASPCFVTIEQLCVRETRVNRAVWSHRAALIKGVSLSLLSQSLTSSLLLLCPAFLAVKLAELPN